ncbi:unnamed protein product [Schistosoma mattheei]|uniref:Uncharacterized protein n=1 Tax=Schistosoma mattheei TaxID=31246 RepID=A0A3P7XAX1_9TREM|nr:unnamed protein product [Schistosoma mattheei]
MGLVGWMYLHLRVDVHSRTQTPVPFAPNATALFTQLLSPRVNIKSEMQVHPADESQTGRNARPGFHC